MLHATFLVICIPIAGFGFLAWCTTFYSRRALHIRKMPCRGAPFVERTAKEPWGECEMFLFPLCTSELPKPVLRWIRCWVLCLSLV